MIGYALITGQKRILNIVEGTKVSNLTCLVKDESGGAGIGRLSIDTFKTGSTGEMKSLVKQCHFLTGTVNPNKLFFMRVDHSVDFDDRKDKINPAIKGQRLDVIPEEEKESI